MSDPHDILNSTKFRTDSERVRALSLARGWTQAKLAKKAGFSKRTAEKLWDGDAVSRDILDRTATAFGVPLAEIVCDELKSFFREYAPHANGPADPSITPWSGVLRPAQLPAPVPNFVGRGPERQTLRDRLCGAAGVVELTTTLHGMGGVGKTSLAVEVGHEVRDRFPDGQVFVDLGGMNECPLTPVQAMARVIHSFHPERRVSEESAENPLSTYRSVLAAAGRVLLILDNAADGRQVSDLLVPPPTGVLFTSRRALRLQGVELVRLDELSMSEAVQLLDGILQRGHPLHELERLAEVCGQLPLALRVAGDFLRAQDDWTIAGYIAALEQNPLVRLSASADDPNKDVNRVLRLSAQQLQRESPNLAERWHLLATVLEGEFEVGEVGSVWKRHPDAPMPDPDHVHFDLSELTARSMLGYDRTHDKYRFHDLMRPIAAGLYGE